MRQWSNGYDLWLPIRRCGFDSHLTLFLLAETCSFLLPGFYSSNLYYYETIFHSSATPAVLQSAEAPPLGASPRFGFPQLGSRRTAACPICWLTDPACGGSSVWLSNGLQNRRSGVRIPLAAPGLIVLMNLSLLLLCGLGWVEECKTKRIRGGFLRSAPNP